MGIVERKERERAGMRAQILLTARELILTEGLDNISIRKIAAKIEYSPAIIYHYFENKEEIIARLIEDEYERLMTRVPVLKDPDLPARQKMRMGIRNYITVAVEMGEFYKSMMLSRSPLMVENSSVLRKGSSSARPLLAMVCETIKALPGMSEKTDDEIELKAQMVWATVFGISLRIYAESIEGEARNRLIDAAVEFVLTALGCLQTQEKDFI